MPRPPFSSARSARPSASAAAEATVDAAIGPGEAARLFADCGPFEPRPQVAVAVSGGADSLALAWLLQRWLAGQGGRLHALIVDHRLRPGSAEEAADVSARLATLGIDSRILVWEGAAEVSAGVQAAARDARYSLLIEACRSAGVLHLALGHHRDDQVETLLQRANSGSGPDGLAAMPSVAELPDVRLIRPLLTVPKARLAATCLAAGLPFVEDPSNRDARFARSRLRAQAVEFALAGLAPEPLFSLATTAGRLRAELEQRVAALLAEDGCATSRRLRTGGASLGCCAGCPGPAVPGAAIGLYRWPDLAAADPAQPACTADSPRAAAASGDAGRLSSAAAAFRMAGGPRADGGGSTARAGRSSSVGRPFPGDAAGRCAAWAVCRAAR